MNTSVLPTTTRLGLSNGLVDLGGNNTTLSSVTFTNDLDNTPFNPATGSAGVGIIGTGNLTSLVISTSCLRREVLTAAATQ